MIIATDVNPGDEARRVLDICNACRYCEGLCATFQAMTLRRSFDPGDVDYLANLCHNCTACYHDCQYAPPHEFAVNVPQALTAARVETYTEYAWPRSLGLAFERNGLVVFAISAVVLSLTIALALMLIDETVLLGRHGGPGAFYQVVGHGMMVAVAGGTFGFSLLALGISLVKFWRAMPGSPGRPKLRHLLSAISDSGTLKYLDGGHGEGCSSVDDGFSNQRRYFHQLTMWGFLLCFAATCVASIYDFGFGWIAPYPYFSAPVLLGTIGGVGLLVGPAGLLVNKWRSDRRPLLLRSLGMDYAFIVSLFVVSLSGLLLLGLRETSAMGVVLIVHLGLVLAFFLLLPYSKFVHGLYRFAALLRFAAEREQVDDVSITS